MVLSQRALNISESLTLAIDAKAKKMRAEGFDVVGFGAGEPDFNTPDHIIKAAKEALDSGITKYTSSSGTPELKKAICRKLEKDNSLLYTPQDIIVSNGAKHSLYNVFQAILNPGDEVIIPSPYWLTYPELVKMAGGKPVFIETSEENDFKLTMDALMNAVTSSTKALILNSPSNPCGSVYDENELRQIAELAIEKNFFVVSDEIYEELIYDRYTHVSIASLGNDIKDLTITVNGMSKAYAMTGWRIGYTAGPREVINVMSNIQSHSTSNPNAVAQYASAAALNSPKDFTKMMASEFSSRRLYMVERVNKIKDLSCKTPRGAFYIMMNISNAIGKRYGDMVVGGSLDFANILLDTKLVTVVPGVAFGSDSHVRLSYATSMENITMGLNRIEEFMYELV